MLRAPNLALRWTLALGTPVLALGLAVVAPRVVAAHSQAPVGMWQTIDDATSKPKSHVEIYEKDGKLYGRIVKLLERPDARCEKCTGADYNKPLVGMTILRDMVLDGDSWSGGKIFDPESGKTYRCKLWFDGTKLKVRGYLGPLFRTQTWHPLPK